MFFLLKRFTSVGLIALLFVLSACNAPWSNNDNKKIVKDPQKGDNQSVTLIPQSDSKDYKTIHANNPANSRGFINNNINNRVDIDNIELGLKNMSKSPFSPDNYAFQEGQYLKQSDINQMLYRKSKAHPQGLNPALGSGPNIQVQAQKSPEELNYVLEQDYLKPSGNNSYKLGGVSIAVSLNQVYSASLIDPNSKLTYQVNAPLDVNKVKAAGKTYAQEILKRIRAKKGLSNVPIFMSLYLEAPQDSLTPGHFYAKTLVSSGSSNISSWDSVSEQHVLFPSDSASTNYKSDAQSFDKFKSDVQSYFTNYIGTIGKGTYRNGQLTNLNIDISIKFYDKTEVVSFTNYVASVLENKFPFSRDIPVNISITSVNQPEALIVKNSTMDKPFVYVYNNGA